MNDVINDKGTEVQPYDSLTEKRRKRSDVFPGLFIMLVGALLLLRQTGIVYPYWFFTWPVFLIAIGIFVGLKHNFRGGGWMVPILIGSLFLIDKAFPGLAVRNYIWPIVLMGFGLLLILRPKKRNHQRRWTNQIEENNAGTGPGYNDYQSTPTAGNDYIDTTAILGGVKKIVMSKSFKGGNIINFMGGTEINLTQADIQTGIIIDATNIFGGTKLIVPPTWDVQTDVVAIFGGVDDKRQITANAPNPTKILKLEGTCIFGGIEIRSF